MKQSGKKYKKRKAQHLVEFILFFPFFLAILGILMDFSMALYSNYKFNLALHQAINLVWMEDKLGSDSEQIAKRIEDTAKISMKESKAIYADTVKTGFVYNGDMWAVTASYDYTTAFTLVNFFFPALPEKFFFKTAVIVNNSILKPNFYSIPEAELDGISFPSQADEPAQPGQPEEPEVQEEPEEPGTGEELPPIENAGEGGG